MKKDILFPIFLKCSSLAKDTFWRYLYEDLSYGKCPYGISLHKNYLSCHVKGKEFTYKIDNNRLPEDIFQEIDSLLRERAGILSEKEKIIERSRLYRQRVAPEQNNKQSNGRKEEWTQVKKKIIRDTLLEQFVLDHARKYHLSIQQAKQVLSFLIVGLMFKSITARDIFYQNGFITQIQGISFEKGSFHISKNILCCKGNTFYAEEQPSYVSKTLQAFWPVYLEDIKLLK